MIWINARDMDPSGIDIPLPGKYSVWLWAPDDDRATVTINGNDLAVAPAESPKTGYTWRKADFAHLKGGLIQISVTENVAAVAMSISETFDPGVAMRDMSVFTQPESAHDHRVYATRHTDTVYTMPQYGSLAEWEAVAAKIRKRMLLACGLWPMPEKTPLNAQITGRIQHDDYSVERVCFEARPGFYVTGNLYRPVGKGPFPAVICPHGHWDHGRLEDGQRGSFPARLITLARMGMVGFNYDMIGYNDSLQVTPHRAGSALEKLWGISRFGMQLWQSIRVVDFLQSLPDVDSERIACTGASGGATQTFALYSVDPRIKVAAPVNMISCSMQGGCICENPPLLRFDVSNLEIGAMMAPRPILMISATGDWTVETPRIEYPAIRSIYRLYGAEDNVQTVQIDAEHNYNKASREAMYPFMGKYLLNEPQKWSDFKEPPYTAESIEDLRVFPDDKLPDGALTEEQLIANMIKASREKWLAALPKTPEDVSAFHAEYGDALALVLGASVPDINELKPERIGAPRPEGVDYIPDCVGLELRKKYAVERWLIHRLGVGDSVPALLYRAHDATPQDAVLIVHSDGKAALANPLNGKPGPLVTGLIEKGKAVLVIDTFLIGDHHSPFAKTVRQTVGAFHDTFAPSDTAYRIQDILTALAFLRSRRDLTGRTQLVGLGTAGAWCAFAAALDDSVVNTVIDANHFDIDNDQAWLDAYNLPCIRSTGDIHTAAAMLAPRPLTLFHASPSFETAVNARYKAIDAEALLSARQDALNSEALLSALDV